MAFWTNLFAAGVLLALPHPAFPQGDQAGRYSVEISLFDGERLVGRPKLTLPEGQIATVTLGKDGDYAIRLAATKASGEPARPRVRISADVFLRDGADWRNIASPTITVPLGQPANMTIQRRNEAGAVFRMEVLARAAAWPPLSVGGSPN